MSSVRSKSLTDQFEENAIALILGIMTLITFVNVLARKSYDLAIWFERRGLIEAPDWLSGNILWAVEATVFLFAWLVLLGASYAVKHTAHLGVDVIINIVSPAVRQVLGFISIAACLLFAIFLCKAAWDYWALFANLPPTEGRWLPLGFAEKYRGQGWYETKDIPMPGFLAWMKDILNEGEAYEKMPKVIPYFVMPLSMALLLLRFVQAAIRMVRGHQDRVIVSHEVEDQVEAAAEKLEKA